ncbi:hypothetical protein MtrunA17_Chr4g0004851 [Medicago truncatula]|uniref:Uncharacterized protein n=1 Tax=Medicago truncatula TaxID=3880 RepID=A0A396HZC7_MEDTR|nr:hypothetical protein MtrunA17_Chr4g0004851 [Medicago truncatula]
MAFQTNQSYLFDILCIFMMMSSGFVASVVVPPGGVCTVPCTATCDRDCHDKGFQKSGCFTHLEKTTCCCFH